MQQQAGANLAVEVLYQSLVLGSERLGDAALAVQAAQQRKALAGQVVNVLLQRREAARRAARARACARPRRHARARAAPGGHALTAQALLRRRQLTPSLLVASL